jgi:membrane protein DedA with SNARE-associated domain
VFQHFTDLVANASGWAYAILFVLAFLDALIPIVPSETSVITAGVLASSGELSLPMVVLFDAIAATSWALYASLLGYVGGHTFEAQPWKGLLLAFAIAFAVTGTVELVRWYQRRRRSPA